METAEIETIISGTGMAVAEMQPQRSRSSGRPSAGARQPHVDKAEIALNAISELIERHKNKNNDKAPQSVLQSETDAVKTTEAELTIDPNVQLVTAVSAVVRDYLAGREVPRSGIAAGDNEIEDIDLEDGPKEPAKFIARVSNTESDELQKFQLEATTHPIIHSDDHADNLVDFAQGVLAAGRRLKHKLKYTRVEVLLMSWEEEKDETSEDIKRVNKLIEDEIRTVHELFEQTLRFSVERYRIPLTDPQTKRDYNWQRKVQMKVTSFVDVNDTPDTLLILYYNGHGSCHDHSCYWHPTEDASEKRSGFRSDLQFYGPHLEWNPIQNSISTERDLLIILDCCYAGASFLNADKGRTPTTQTLAACSRGQKTPAGPNSFTMRFVKAVKGMLAESISKIPITELYRVMVSSRLGPQPFHVQRGPGSITLEALPDPNAAVVEGHLEVAGQSQAKGRSRASSASNADTNTVFSTLKPGERAATDQSSVSSTSSSLRVAMVVRLKADVTPQAANWEKVIEAFPPEEFEELESVSVDFEAAIPTNSTMVIVTIPMDYWLLLSENPAYSFLGFVTGRNMLLPPRAEKLVQQVPVQRTNSDEISQAKIGEADIANQIVEAMLEFFESAKSQDHFKERRPGRFQQMATKIGFHPDSPKQPKLETDPYFVKVRHLVQKLKIVRNEKGEYTSLSYDLHFTEIARLFDLTRKSVKETIHKVSPPRMGELEATINTEFDQLEKGILTQLEEEKNSKFYAIAAPVRPSPSEHTKSSTRLSIRNNAIPETDGAGRTDEAREPTLPRASTANTLASTSKPHPKSHRKSESLDAGVALAGKRPQNSRTTPSRSSRSSRDRQTDSGFGTDSGFESMGGEARKARILHWRRKRVVTSVE